jgi:hypothetical protein
MEKIWHTIKFKVGRQHSNMPDPWRDDLDEVSGPTQWCIDTVGLQGYAWKRIFGSGMMFYYFEKQTDAALFRLTWSEY